MREDLRNANYGKMEPTVVYKANGVAVVFGGGDYLTMIHLGAGMIEDGPVFPNFAAAKYFADSRKH